jgi:enolase-phosphatase E1
VSPTSAIRVPRGLLLDVEGTTTPIRFVYETLFPFARARLAAYLAEGAGDSEVRARIEQLHGEWGREAPDPGGPPHWLDESPVRSAAVYALWLMDRDRKSTALKALQGDVWRSGYESGELRGEVFADVGPSFRRWHESGCSIRIFSSGSVPAQKLLFRYSTSGDLTPYLDGYYDTTTGPKSDAQSYRRISAAAGIPPGEMLFLSDSVPELEAARMAGLGVALSVRPGNTPPASPPEVWPRVTSFGELS